MSRQSIILAAHEARQLQSGAGSVLAVRAVKPQPKWVPYGNIKCDFDGFWAWQATKYNFCTAHGNNFADFVRACPYPLGARLAVRETWAYVRTGPATREVHFAIDTTEQLRWRSASTMPMWASRATVEVVGVECRRVCEIKESDATLCGFVSDVYPPDDDGNRCFKRAREVFASDWGHRHGARYPWASAWAWYISLEIRSETKSDEP